MILTSQDKLGTKATSVYYAWAQKCDNYKFITKIPDTLLKKNKLNPDDKSLIENGVELNHQFDILQPAGLEIDTYENLTNKVFLTLKHVYKKYNNYDWYLKADDDTFIFVDNLREFLKDKDPNDPVTYGYDFKVIVEKGYHSGGGGYLLSNNALLKIGERLSKNQSSCINTGTEDVDVATCLRTLKVYPDKSIDEFGRERFHPLSMQDHYNGGFYDWMIKYASNPLRNGTNCCSDTSISFHYMSEIELLMLSYIVKQMEDLNIKYNFEMIYKNMFAFD